MLNYIIQLQIDSFSKTSDPQTPDIISNNISENISFWFWITLIELVIILYLFFKLNKKKGNLVFADLSKDKVKAAKSTNIDMDNLMNSINRSKGLYKELSKKCHPDRFINSNKQSLAEDIFQNISKHKRDFEKLSELKERAKIELEIKFK